MYRCQLIPLVTKPDVLAALLVRLYNILVTTVTNLQHLSLTLLEDVSASTSVEGVPAAHSDDQRADGPPHRLARHPEPDGVRACGHGEGVPVAGDSQARPAQERGCRGRSSTKGELTQLTAQVVSSKGYH